MNIKTITAENLKNESQGAPLLVDFWAPWCGYCRRLSPVIDRIAQGGNYDGKLAVGKVNIDEEPSLAAQFFVNVIPTLLLVRDGAAGEPLVNPGSQGDIDAWLKAQGVEL